MRPRRRLLVPEIVQTSSMDCGPAVLKCLLEGFGIRASYGRLREACQTDVDGTSIDTMEEVARQLGLDATQTMVPVDHLLRPEATTLPCIVVVRLPNGIAHFLVAWKRHGPFLQLMDPATGRRWTTCRAFLDEIFIHTQSVPGEAWRAWAGTESFLGPLRRRIRDLGISSAPLVVRAAADAGWRSLAALDAATRLVGTLVASKAIRPRGQARRLLERLLENDDSIPADCWSVRPDGDAELAFRGAVLVQVRGLLAEEERQAAPASPELAAALREPPARPGRELLQLLAADGVLRPAVLAAALVLGAGAVLVEALLFRGLLDISRELSLAGQRIGALAALVIFLFALLLLEGSLGSSLLRAGRRLELRLRVAFLMKLPKLGDRYFQSRLKSDMAERGHSIHRIRHLPELGAHLVRSAFELVFTTIGIIWLDPGIALPALLAAVLGMAVPWSFQPLLCERDLRFRTHSGALSRFYLDALLGLTPIRTHGAERAVRREHAHLLVTWARAGLSQLRMVAWTEAAQFSTGLGLAALLLMNHIWRHGEMGGVLLLLYWALNIPMLGQEIALAARQYPGQRNLTLRLTEPLGALEESQARAAPAEAPKACGTGMSIVLEEVSVRAAGHTILEHVNVKIDAGSHVAIVGPSGAGKSSFAGLLLGWHRPATGTLQVDGVALEGRFNRLRRETAWVDPAVQLWNRSFHQNLVYGSSDAAAPALGEVLDIADLIRVLERLPDGLETPLGEGGALVSGGEGHRVRLARAMLRPGVRLVILDEPFRGLDCNQRRELLARARRLWSEATLLCITHDIGDTLAFPRVLVMEGGRILEDASPMALTAAPRSRYRALLDAEAAVREKLWSGGNWRRLTLREGTLHEA